MGVGGTGAVAVAALTFASAGAEARRFGEGSGFWDMNSRQGSVASVDASKAAFLFFSDGCDRRDL